MSNSGGGVDVAKVLVACEESQVVTAAMRAAGHEAYSCDILETSGSHPEWHIQGDVLHLLQKPWDAVIAFPPCTHLCVSGARHWAKKIADGRQQDAIEFFMAIANANAPYIAIENPVGLMSTRWRKPDQTIHPTYFGDPVHKRTCLWLKGFPKLVRTRFDVVNSIHITSKGTQYDAWWFATSVLPLSERSKARSKTFQGVADAMGKQWGDFLHNKVDKDFHA